MLWEAAARRRKRISVDVKSMIVRGKKGGKKKSEEGGTQMIAKRGLKKDPTPIMLLLASCDTFLCN